MIFSKFAFFITIVLIAGKSNVGFAQSLCTKVYENDLALSKAIISTEESLKDSHTWVQKYEEFKTSVVREPTNRLKGISLLAARDLISPYVGFSSNERLLFIEKAIPEEVNDIPFAIEDQSQYALQVLILANARINADIVIETIANIHRANIAANGLSETSLVVPIFSKAQQASLARQRLEDFQTKLNFDYTQRISGPEIVKISHFIGKDLGISIRERKSFIDSLPETLRKEIIHSIPLNAEKLGPTHYANKILLGLNSKFLIGNLISFMADKYRNMAEN
jgi:hypothetical protein